MLKKAVKGEYIIQTNYFGDSQLTISGPTTLMAEIYLHYSDGRQERKIVVLQSDEQEKEDGVMIGKFKF